MRWGVVFRQWIPEIRQPLLKGFDDGVSTRLWIGETCLDPPTPSEDVARHLNMNASKCFVDVLVQGVVGEIAQFIVDERDSPRGVHHGVQPGTAEFVKLREEYRSLGHRVYHAVMKTVNRFLSFARNHQGQWWLDELAIDVDRLLMINDALLARVSSSTFTTEVRWCPPATAIIRVGGGRTGAIRAEDWSTCGDFVASARRAPLPLELLANAESLLRTGKPRSAIIEAISALEVCLFEFAESPIQTETPWSDKANRIRVDRLRDQARGLGLRGSVRFLLPLLFPEELLPTAVIAACQDAVDLRNNVVHNGQRAIEDESVRKAIRHIRAACGVLRQFTAPGDTA